MGYRPASDAHSPPIRLQFISVVSFVLCAVMIGFFAYLINELGSYTDWADRLGLATSIIDLILTFFLTFFLTFSLILGSRSGPNNRSEKYAMIGLPINMTAWILMLVAASCMTARLGFYEVSLGELTDYCNDGWNVPCAWGVGIALSWTVFCLLFVNTFVLIAFVLTGKHAATQHTPDQV